MCDYCAEHGAGKKWYLEAKNYLRNHKKDDRRRKNFAEDFIEHFMTTYERFLKNGELNQILPNDDPSWVERLKMKYYFKYLHSGQVIPKEEAKLVMELSGQISLIPCVCRYANAGEKHNVCMIFMNIPDNLYGKNRFDKIRDLEVLTVEEAKLKIDEFADTGYVQSVWTFLSPHIGAICNCDYPFCTALRYRRHTGINRSMYKSEYIADINESLCENCGSCVPKCQFGALTVSPSHGTAIVNVHQCFGCGVCREACTNGAIKLIPREQKIPNPTW